ncbi:MAG: YhcH/YjgK/YiaL family protein [Candidatus Omnitrophota bacterium]
MAIYGKLDDILRQDISNVRIKEGLRYLCGVEKGFLADKPVGYVEKVEISGRNIYAMHQVNQTKPAKEARLEAHREYIDLQYVWEGQEVTELSIDNGYIGGRRFEPDARRDDEGVVNALRRGGATKQQAEDAPSPKGPADFGLRLRRSSLTCRKGHATLLVSLSRSKIVSANAPIIYRRLSKTITGRDGLRILTPYDKKRDVEFFEYSRAASLVMKPGTLAIFYPFDVHAPGIIFKRRQLVRKTVVKVRVQKKRAPCSLMSCGDYP